MVGSTSLWLVHVNGVYKFPTDPESTTSSICLTSKCLAFINSLNLAVICYSDSAQGRYSFPQKAYEILACRVPLVAASVGTMQDLLKDQPKCLFEPGQPRKPCRGRALPTAKPRSLRYLCSDLGSAREASGGIF